MIEEILVDVRALGRVLGGITPPGAGVALPSPSLDTEVIGGVFVVLGVPVDIENSSMRSSLEKYPCPYVLCPVAPIIRVEVFPQFGTVSTYVDLHTSLLLRYK